MQNIPWGLIWTAKLTFFVFAQLIYPEISIEKCSRLDTFRRKYGKNFCLPTGMVLSKLEMNRMSNLTLNFRSYFSFQLRHDHQECIFNVLRGSILHGYNKDSVIACKRAQNFIGGTGIDE